jgi:hypothetical protein
VHVTMIACSDPPEGYGRWSLHMREHSVILTAHRGLLYNERGNATSPC